MKYLFAFTILLLLSCEAGEGTLVGHTKSATAVLNYPINSSNPVSDVKSFGVRDLIFFLVSSSGINYDEILKITIQGISIQVSVNNTNTASSLSFQTSVARVNCNGSTSTLTPFSLDHTLPLQVFGFNVPIAVSVDLSSAGVAELNSILANDLPYLPSNDYGFGSCTGINFNLAGNVSPVDKNASLNLNVVVIYNVKYTVCEDNDFLEALSGIEDKCY